MAGIFHLDPTMDRAWQQLAEAQTAWGRATAREGLVFFIPVAPDEKPIILYNGHLKEVELAFEQEELQLAFEAAMRRRFGRTPP